VWRHQQQRTQCRLEEQIVVDADDVERIPIDQRRLGGVFVRRFVALQGDAEADAAQV
jgi:hypothetical protein